MAKYHTMGDVRLAADGCGMTIERFFAESYPEELEGVDWNDERPSKEYLAEQLRYLNNIIENLEKERQILKKWHCAIPEEMDRLYSKASKEWTELYWMSL